MPVSEVRRSIVSDQLLSRFAADHGMPDIDQAMERADIGKLREALTNGKCDTKVISTCYLRPWLNTMVSSSHP